MKNKYANLILLVFAVAMISGCKPSSTGEKTATGTTKEFKGIIKLDVRDSQADWGPYETNRRANLKAATLPLSG